MNQPENPFDNPALSKGTLRAMAEMQEVLNRIADFEEQLRARKFTKDELISLCAAAFFAAEARADKPSRLLEGMRQQQGTEQLIEMLAALPPGANLISAMDEAKQFNVNNKTIGLMANIFHQVKSTTRSDAARNSAKARHSNSPVQEAKSFVHDLWLNWQNGQSTYKSTSAFSKDMLEKKPDELSSQQVIERWCRAWKKELGKNITLPAK